MSNELRTWLTAYALFAVGVIVLWAILTIRDKLRLHYCPDCGYVGRHTERLWHGDDLTELLLYVFGFGTLGVIYSLWRSCTSYVVCPSCYSRKITATKPKPDIDQDIDLDDDVFEVVTH